MSKTNLILIDMSNANGTSGVTRYLQCLIKGVVETNIYNILWINLVHDPKLFFHKVSRSEGYTRISIPLPEVSNEIIREIYWMEKFNDIVWKIASPNFDPEVPTVIHIHTLNNISLAKLIASKLRTSRVITHLHCIPWKDSYNREKERFNELYKTYYTDKKYDDNRPFLTHSSELDSYHSCDKVVCVTRCAAEFLGNMMKVPIGKISVIPNGMQDMRPRNKVLAE